MAGRTRKRRQSHKDQFARHYEITAKLGASCRSCAPGQAINGKVLSKLVHSTSLGLDPKKSCFSWEKTQRIDQRAIDRRNIKGKPQRETYEITHEIDGRQRIISVVATWFSRNSLGRALQFLPD